MRSLTKLGFLGMVIAAAAANTACSKAEEEDAAKHADWSCHTSAVPMGNVTTCTTRSAMTTDNGSTYDCNPAESLLCPAPTDEGGSAATEAPSDDGSGAGGGDTPSGDGQTGEGSVGNNPSGGANSDDGSGNGGGNDATQGSTGDGNVSGGPNDECSYVPDLDYCGGGSGSSDGSGNTSSGGNPDGQTGDGNVNGGSSGSSGGDSSQGCAPNGQTKCPPGQTKKPDGPNGGSSGGASSGNGGASSGGASSGGSSGGGGGGKGKNWKCEKSSSGTTTCTSEPTCKPGTHPAPCGACVPDSEPPSCDCVPPTTGGCWVTGGGFVEAASLVPAAPADGHDNFGGNAKPMKDGTVKGQWNHVDHGTGNHAHGQPTYLFCRKIDGAGPGQPGGKKGLTSNQVYFGGPARWRTGATWNDGYWFDVVAVDRGEPGSSAATKKGLTPDNYHITVRKQSDPVAGVSGAVVYETKGGLSGGNIQIHPPNNGHPAVSSPLPAWVALED